jgi:hypothetical protein
METAEEYGPNSTGVGKIEMRKLISLCSALLACGTLVAPPVVAGEKHGVMGSVVIKAPANVVWDTIKKQRELDPDMEYSNTLSRNGNDAVIEQKFTGLPVWGSTTNVISEHETPFSRVDYKLIKSDKLKKLEGSWVLTPAENGASTRLSLSSHLDVGIPFTGGIAKRMATKLVSKRLTNVKILAEQTQRKIVESGKGTL